MADNPRIEELRRRVEKDPASIAFAQLAEEFRRAGDYDEAVRTCRNGLARHPSYLSARVTLGRALIELRDYEAAQAELECVLRSAPENLAAIRGLGEIHQRRGNLAEALRHYQTALGIAKHDPELEESVHDLTLQVAREAAAAGPASSAPEPSSPPAISAPQPPSASDPPSIPLGSLSPELEAAADEFTKALQALDALSLDLPAVEPVDDGEELSPAAEDDETHGAAPTADDAAVEELESWLDAIARDRAAREAHAGQGDWNVPSHGPMNPRS